MTTIKRQPKVSAAEGVDSLVPGGNGRVSTAARTGATPAGLASPRLSGQALTPWLLVAMTGILFAGALFGYDQGVISGALTGIK